MPDTSNTTAAALLAVIPLVMRSVAAELRASGDLPAPAHFGLLSMLAPQPRTLTELAQLQGVSLPTMSNSISRLVERGWVTRTAHGSDRRVVRVTVTPRGRATLRRVGQAAEAHLAERLAALDERSRKRLHAGLDVLQQVFGETAARGPQRTANLRAKRSV